MSPQPLTADIIGEHERWLLYGKPKTGKTFAALTVPPPIYFMAVGSSDELKTFFSTQFQEKHKLKKEEIFFDVGRTSQEVKDLMETAIEDAAAGRGPDFASIIVDNATPLTDYHLEVALEIAYNVKVEGGKKTNKTAKATLDEYNAMIPQQGDWGVAQNIMRRFLSDLISVDKHLVLIAHEYEVMGRGEGQTQVLKGVEPWFIGKDRTFIGNKFDNVWRMTKEAQFYVARTEAGRHPDGYDQVAGSRIGGIIPKDYANPNLTEVIAKYRKHAESVK